MANLNVRNIESYNQIISKKEYKEGKLVKKVQIDLIALLESQYIIIKKLISHLCPL